MIPDVMPAAPLEPATADRRGVLVDVLVDAFTDDPILRWLYPGDDYPELARAWFDLATDRLWSRSDVYVDPGGNAGSLWVRPGVTLVEPDDLVAIRSLWREQLGDRVDAAVEAVTATDGYEPHGAHGFCLYVGVRRSAQRRGFGQAVMRPALAGLEAAGLPAYLVSSNERNVSFYMRLGFEAQAEVWAVDGITVRPMLRAPAEGEPA